MEENLKKYIDELISEIQNELDEATVTGNIDGYQTPHAFSDKGSSDKNRKKKMVKRIGYTLTGKVDESFISDLDIIKNGSKDITDFIKKVLSDKQYKEVRTDKEFHKYLKSFYNESVNENLITERQLKGLEGINDKTPLTKISDAQKLKIVQGTGNLISFKIPSWSKDKKWTVISSGKIVKKKNLNGETIFFLQGKGGIIKASPTYPSVKELLDGVNWDTMELRRESVNEGLFSDIMKGVKKGSSPYSLVVIQNNKVVKQVETNTDRAIPAHFTTLKKEYPNSRIRVEDSTGKIVFEK